MSWCQHSWRKTRWSLFQGQRKVSRCVFMLFMIIPESNWGDVHMFDNAHEGGKWQVFMCMTNYAQAYFADSYSYQHSGSSTRHAKKSKCMDWKSGSIQKRVAPMVKWMGSTGLNQKENHVTHCFQRRLCDAMCTFRMLMIGWKVVLATLTAKQSDLSIHIENSYTTFFMAMFQNHQQTLWYAYWSGEVWTIGPWMSRSIRKLGTWPICKSKFPPWYTLIIKTSIKTLLANLVYTLPSPCDIRVVSNETSLANIATCPFKNQVSRIQKHEESMT